MLRKTTIFAACLAIPAAASAYDIKPKTPDTGFSGKIKPDILGLSTEQDAAKAKDIIEAYFKGRQGVKPNVQQQTFASTAVTYVPSMSFDLAASAKDSGESIVAAFSSPASANRTFMITRTIAFAADQQPLKADLLKQLTDKYGEATLIGDQHVYYFYRGGKIVSVGQKYKPDTALEALDKPVNPKAAVALNNAKGQGSCVATVKRIGTLDKTLKALRNEANDANCEAALSIALSSGASADRVGKAEFMLADFKRMTSAASIDDDALAAAKSEQTKTPAGSAPKL